MKVGELARIAEIKSVYATLPKPLREKRGGKGGASAPRLKEKHSSPGAALHKMIHAGAKKAMKKTSKTASLAFDATTLGKLRGFKRDKKLDAARRRQSLHADALGAQLSSKFGVKKKTKVGSSGRGGLHNADGLAMLAEQGSKRKGMPGVAAEEEMYSSSSGAL